MAIIAEIIYNAAGEPLAPSDLQLLHARQLSIRGGRPELEAGYIYKFGFLAESQTELDAKIQNFKNILDKTGHKVWILDEKQTETPGVSRPFRYGVYYALEDAAIAHQNTLRTSHSATHQANTGYRSAHGSAQAPIRIAA